MMKKIKDTILDKLFWMMNSGCEFCINKARDSLNDNGKWPKFEFWHNLAWWFNKMEKRIYFIQYGKAL